MRRRLTSPVLLLVLATAAIVATTSVPATAAPQARVINGTPVAAATYDARWRSIATLVTRGEADTRKGHFCGGTFIAPQVVATAAHCVVDNSHLLLLDDAGRYVRYNNARGGTPTQLQVVAGRRSLSVRDGDRIDVAQILIHPRYDAVLGSSDIALLQLARAPSASAGVVPMVPVQPGEDAIWGAGAGVAASATTGPWVAGWGLRVLPTEDGFFTDSHGVPILRPTKPVKRPTLTANGRAASGRSLANTLEEVLVPIQPDSRCDVGGGAGTPDRGYGRVFDVATMLCAGTLDSSDANDEGATTNGVDSCYGDSGGPMLASTGSALRLVGIVSFGTGCAMRDSFGVYTRVAAFREFLATSPRRPVQVAARPTIEGDAVIGGTLTCSPGRWLGAGTKRYSYRWVRPLSQVDAGEAVHSVAEAWQRIPSSGAKHTYQVKPGDRGTRVTCLVIATNGQTTAAENANARKIPGEAPVDPEQEQEEGEDDGDSSLPALPTGM